MRGFVTRRRVLGQGVTGEALLAGACAPGGGAGTETAGGGAGSASRAPADVVYMTSWNQERLAVLDQGLAIFKEKQPQIKVTVAPSPGNDQIGALFVAARGRDAEPDRHDRDDQQLVGRLAERVFLDQRHPTA